VNILYVIVFFIGNFLSNSIYAQNVPKVIIFSKTVKYRHQSIEAGIESIKKLGEDNSFQVSATEDSEVLISNLKNSDAVIFLSPSGDIFNYSQQEKFKNFIENGGGFIGIHGAAATEADWPWFGKLVGAVFLDHPKLQDATVEVVNHNHLSTSFLKDTWVRYDEWYNFYNMDPNIQVLLNLDETSYSGGKHGKNHPIAWYKEYKNRKVFYTALGHTEKSFNDETFLNHILGGIQYVLDNN